MKRLFLFLILPFFGGCFIHLNVKLNLFPDGRVSRTTEYATDTRSDLEEQYLLPAHGAWVSDSTGKGTTTWHYTVEENFPGYKKIVSAYVRKGKRPDHISSSRPVFKITNYFFFADYEYREEFYDGADTARARAAVRELGARYIIHLKNRMRQDRFPEGKIGQAAANLAGWWEDVYRSLQTGKNIDSWNDDSMAQRLGAVLYDTSRMARADKKLLLTRMTALVKLVDQDFSPEADTLSARWEADDIFGVYGITPLSEYTFDVQLTLPGSVIKTDGARLGAGYIRWQFQNRDFFAKPRTLYAHARKVNLFNIIIAVIVIIGLNTVALVFRRRKMRK